MNKIHKKILYLFLLPIFAVMLVMVAYPFISNIVYSFLDYKISNPVKTFIFLNNYIDAFHSSDFFNTLLKTLKYTLGTITCIFFIGLATGLLLDSGIKGVGIIKVVLLIPWVIPEIATGYTWKWMLTGDYGIVNRILLNLHLITPDFSWFRDGNTAMISCILANTWRAFPFVAIMIYAKKKTIPIEWIEAGKIDGANQFQIFYYITLRYILPVLSKVITLIFIWTYNSFDIIFAMTGGGPLKATETFPIFIRKTAFDSYNFGMASATSIMMMCFMLLLLFAGTKTAGGISKLKYNLKMR